LHPVKRIAENAKNKNNFIFLPIGPHPFPDTRWEFSIHAFILPLLPHPAFPIFSENRGGGPKGWRDKWHRIGQEIWNFQWLSVRHAGLTNLHNQRDEANPAL